MKKKIFISLIALSLATGFILTNNHVEATDFVGQETKYIKLCSSSKLSKSQQKTCKEFNTYLNNKNKKLSQEAKDAKKDAQDVKASIEEVAKKISEVDTKISSAQAELKYIQKNIDQLNKNITDKSQKLEERLYAMQTTVNSNMYVSYLFGADSFTDFMSRLINFKEITTYDNELIDEMNESLDEIKQQESTLKDLKSSLEKDKETQKDLQKTFQAKLLEQNKTIANNSSEISKNQESMEAIQSNLAAIQKAADESKVSNVTQATPNKKPTKKPSQNTQNNNSNQTNDNNQNTQPNQDTPTDNSNDLSSSEELGLKIANLALTRQGYMYVWGGAHSWSSIKDPNWTQFDCSGLVNWAHYHAGVDLGRIHYTGSMINAGKGISKSQLQAGDIILFSSNGSSTGVHHVGIYIGNNQMVHAPTTGKPVQVANLNNSYWQREWYSCRRLY